jgi:hypothetical protein
MTSNHQPRELIVRARRQGKIDARREQRIHEAFKRCGVRPPDVDWTAVSTGDERPGRRIEEDLTEHNVGICVTDREGEPAAERARRLAAELRSCGLVVNIEQVSDEE